MNVLRFRERYFLHDYFLFQMSLFREKARQKANFCVRHAATKQTCVCLARLSIRRARWRKQYASTTEYSSTTELMRPRYAKTEDRRCR